jgi:hypothetical protein
VLASASVILGLLIKEGDFDKLSSAIDYIQIQNFKQLPYSIQCGHTARQSPEVRFQKPVTALQLTANRFGITTNQARHKLGLGHPALPVHGEIVIFTSIITSCMLAALLVPPSGGFSEMY